jgi:acyl-coenzyme A thioesterase PaaI-like protein
MTADPQLQKLLQDALDEVPLHRHFNLRLMTVAEDVRIEMALSPDVAGLVGALHGGATGVLIDVASSVAAAHGGPGFDPLNDQLVTLDTFTRFYGQPRTPRVVATASVRQSVGDVVRVECRVHDENTWLIAAAHVNALILRDRLSGDHQVASESIRAAKNAFGLEDQLEP